MKSNFLLLLISVIFLIGCKNINSKNTSDLSEINKNQRINQTLIDSLMKVSYERGVFNGNILVAKNNKIIYQNELGYTDGSKLKKLNSSINSTKGLINL